MTETTMTQDNGSLPVSLHAVRDELRAAAGRDLRRRRRRRVGIAAVAVSAVAAGSAVAGNALWSNHYETDLGGTKVGVVVGSVGPNGDAEDQMSCTKGQDEKTITCRMKNGDVLTLTKLADGRVVSKLVGPDGKEIEGTTTASGSSLMPVPQP
jgi:hypothetical protein